MIKMIHLDCDGVLADWRLYMETHHFKDFTVAQFNAMDPCRRSTILQEIYRKDKNLFAKLPAIPKVGRLIYHLNRSGEPWGILTSAGEDHPDFEHAAECKRQWLYNRFLVPRQNIIVTENSHRKVDYADPESLLIDDYGRNCREWVEAGGKAIWVHTGNPNIDAVIDAVDDFIHDRAMFTESLISV